MTHRQIGVVLAAGKGTRLKSHLPKVLHPVLGKSMLQRVLESFIPLSLDEVIVVIGHQSQAVQDTLEKMALPFPVSSVIQEPQLGTGHAMMQVLPVLSASTDCTVLVTCGDMPLVPAERYADLMRNHQTSQSVASLVTVDVSNPSGYGRVIFEGDRFLKIVEHKDATDIEKNIGWVNAGIYAVQWPVFCEYFDKLSQNNAQGEFYLTDVLGMLVDDNYPVCAVKWPNEDDVLGINSRAQLAQAADILSARTIENLMAEGVGFIHPHSSVIAPEVTIKPDTVIHPGCYLEGEVAIESHCEIGPNTVMRGQITIGEHCRIIYSYLDRVVTVNHHTYVGPFAHLRDNATVGNNARVGNFVELKETQFGSYSNAAHLCYIGDADVGDDVNMGAGCIIANYDPIRDLKHRSVIEDGVKVGCNSVLVSPVTIQAKACIAAGSVITENVGTWDLAIARCRQTAVKGWVKNVTTKVP